MSEPTMPRMSLVEQDPRRRFAIDVKVQALPYAANVAWNAVRANNDPPKYFAIRRRPVRIVGGTNGEPVSAEYLAVDQLKGISARTAWWFKMIEKQGEVEQHPQETVIRDMLANPNPPLPALERIVTAPVYAGDGTVSFNPGYNPGSLTYFAVPPNLDIPEVPAAPDAYQVDDARDILLGEFLGDFPFTGDADRAHALSLLLNPFVRAMIDGPTPLYMVEAPTAGTGKSLLATLLMVPGTGQPPQLIAPANNDDEMRKVITANLARMPEAIVIDNISKEIKFPSLASALTQRQWTDRVLGRSEVTSFPVRCTWIATGNNPTMTREIARRTIRIRMDAQQERPEERTHFRIRQIERWAQANRGVLIAAALTLCNNWIAQGMQPSSHTLGSYDDWAGVHGGILQAAKIPGFLERRKEDDAVISPEEAAMTAFIEAWWLEHKAQPVGIAELFPIAQRIDGFPLGRSPTDRGMKTSLGMSLSARRDQVIAGKRITFTTPYQGAAQYRLVSVQEDPPW